VAGKVLRRLHHRRRLSQPARALTETDNIWFTALTMWFTALTMNTNQIHFNEV
jgi:acyl dehydratase